MSRKSRRFAESALIALGLTALSLTPSDAALARGKLKGKITKTGDKGMIIRPLSGGDQIIAPSDANGEVRLIGLAAGAYSVQVIGSTPLTPMKVDKDGRLAFAAYEEAPPARPVVLRWAEQIAFEGGASGDKSVYDLHEIRRIRPYPCALSPPGTPPACGAARTFIDVNASTPQEMVRLAPELPMQSAVHIMVQREKGGPYASIEDFARRNCPANDIAINQGAVQVAGLLILMPIASGASAVPGFSCQPRGGPQFSLYGKKHNYVGHVTLLR